MKMRDATPLILLFDDELARRLYVGLKKRIEEGGRGWGRRNKGQKGEKRQHLAN